MLIRHHVMVETYIKIKKKNHEKVSWNEKKVYFYKNKKTKLKWKKWNQKQIVNV